RGSSKPAEQACGRLNLRARFALIGSPLSIAVEPFDDLFRVLTERRRRIWLVIAAAASEDPVSHDVDLLLVRQAGNRQRNSQVAILEPRQFHRLTDGSHHSARNTRT